MLRVNGIALALEKSKKETEKERERERRMNRRVKGERGRQGGERDDEKNKLLRSEKLRYNNLPKITDFVRAGAFRP